MLKNKTFFLILAIFIFGFLVRLWNVWPANTIIGFDQARDLFDSQKIIQGDIRIVGPTAGNNAFLHHGVAFLYFIIPPLFLGQGNPVWVVLWSSLFNTASVIILYFFARSLFNSKWPAILAAVLAAVSYYFIEFSGWISNPTTTLFTAPVFFWGLWEYKKGKNWGLILSSFSLGLTIQFELFFLYLIPAGFLAWLILRPKIPNFKTIFFALCSLFLSLSTMIATEIKFHFSGIASLFHSVSGEKPSFVFLLKYFFDRSWLTFSQNLWPRHPEYGIFIGLFLITVVVYKIFNKTLDSKLKLGLKLLLLYLFSPLLMLLIGVHAAPWFLIGLSPAIIILASYVLSLAKPIFVIPVIILISLSNIQAVKNGVFQKRYLLEPDKSAILSTQLEVIDYTYQKSQGQPFAVNTLTNPLYINAVWAWNYQWYSQKYGYLPSFAGGDQTPPYNTLPQASGQEPVFYLIIDQSPRIPPVYRQEIEKWAQKKGKLVETKDFEGITVQKYQTRFSASQKTSPALLR